MSLPETEDQLMLLHNPHCSKSRATEALLTERGLRFETRRYLDEPLDIAELRDLAGRLGRRPIEFTRTKQAEFAAAGLSQDAPDDAVLVAMAERPILMERPILIRGRRAAIGRPPEAVLDLLD